MKLLEITNEFVVDNLDTSIEFYKDLLDFELIERTFSWAKMQKDVVTIMFETYEEVCREFEDYPKKADPFNLVVFRYDNRGEVEALYKKFLTSENMLFSSLTETDYGSIEFGILDPDYNRIIISC